MTANFKPQTSKSNAKGKTDYRNRRMYVNRNYGYFVSLLKLILPTVALALIVIVVLWPMLSEQGKGFTIKITKEERESAKNMLVFNATYSGIMDDTSQFTITAEQTEQTNPDDAVVTLTSPKGDILGQAGVWYAITADNGRLNKNSGTLELWGDVNAFQDTGIELLTDNIVIDFESNSGYGLDPIKGQGPAGNVEAEGFRIYNSGAKIKLLGHAKVVIYDDGESS